MEGSSEITLGAHTYVHSDPPNDVWGRVPLSGDTNDGMIVFDSESVEPWASLAAALGEINRLRAENQAFRDQFREANEIIAEWEGHTPANPPLEQR